MPILKSEAKTEVIKLETLEGGEVTVVVEPNAGQMEQIAAAQAEDKSFILPLVILISDWNLTGEGGEKLEITADNIRKLAYRDVNKIAARVKDALAPDPEKKE